MTPRRLLAAAIFASAALRLMLAAVLGVGNDEAYYAQLAAHLDWSYFDHPPMLALVARSGLLIGGGGMSPFFLRLGFVGLFSGSSWLMYRLGTRLYDERAGLIAALVLNGMAYYSLAAGTFALPDGPLLFFWLLTLDRLAAACAEPRRLRPWVAVGLAWGGALLSKYHAVFLPIGALGFLGADPRRWPLLRGPGPYLAVLIGLAMFSPVIAWNAAHGWASFAFQGKRAVGAGFHPLALLGAIAGQAAYATPWIWAFLLIALWRAARRPRDAARARAFGADAFLIWQSLPPLIAFVAVACRRAVLPHWSLVGLIPILPMLGRDWASRLAIRRRLVLLSVLPFGFAALYAGQARWGWLRIAADPTADSVGWKTLVGEIRRRGLLDAPGGFLFTSNWYDSGQLAFAADGRVPVLCYAPRGAHNFDLWADPADSIGRSGLLVVVDPCSTEPGMYDRWFERIEPAGEVTIVRRGGPVRHVRLYRCLRQVRPFPNAPARRRSLVAGSRPRGDSRRR